MSKPEKILCVPVFVKEWQSVNSSKLNSFMGPSITYLDIDDIFDGRSCCMLDYVARAENGECGQVNYVIYAAKARVLSTSEGWICEYSNKFKTVRLGKPVTDNTLKEKPRLAQEPRPQVHPFGHRSNTGITNKHRIIQEPDYALNVEDSDLPEAFSSDWDEGDESEVEPDVRESDEEKSLEKLFNFAGIENTSNKFFTWGV